MKRALAILAVSVSLTGCGVSTSAVATQSTTPKSTHSTNPQTVAAQKKAEAARQSMCELVRSVETTSVKAARLGARAGRTRLVFIGDSYTQGVSLPDPLSTYPYVMHHILGAGVVVDGEGGTGLVNDGPCGGGRFDHRLAILLPYQPSPLIIQGGLNDVGLGDITAPAESLIRSWHGPVIVIGPPYAGYWPRSGIDTVAEELRTAASATGAQFVDLRPLTLPPAPDRIHTTAYGQSMIAAAVEQALMNR